jgi:hypothetical protein
MNAWKKTLATLTVFSGLIAAEGAIIQSGVNTYDMNAAHLDNAAMLAVSETYAGDASSTDLINSGQSTYDSSDIHSVVQWGAVSKNGLNEGNVSGNSTAKGTYFKDRPAQMPGTNTYHLNTSVNTLGYDITDITTFAGWRKLGGDLANQKYELLVSTVGSETFDSLGIMSYIPFTEAGLAPNTAATKLTLTDDTGVLAYGVDAVRFVFLDHGENFGGGGDAAGTIYQEIDVFGTASIPEPATLGLIAFMGGAILFVRRTFLI